MNENVHVVRRRIRSGGMGIVTAIFLVVVLAGLGAAAMTLSTAQQQSANMDLLGARALQAARSGLEWGVYQALRNNACAGSSNLAMPAGTTLAGFTVTVTCATCATAACAAVQTTVTRRTIVAVACNRPDGTGTCVVPSASTSPDAVIRRMAAEI